MSNNIYDILKKMQSLETPKQTLTEGKKAKPDFADLDKDGDKKEPMKKAAKEKDKGAIAEAVARVEKNLAEKYTNYKKRLGEESDMKKSVIPVGVIDGPGGYEEAQKRIKDYEAGKINKDGKQLPPVEDRSKPAEKPKTKAVDESGLQAYLGKKKYGEQGMKALQQAGRDGASKEKMALLRAKHDKMDEAVGQEGPADLLAAVEQEINNPGRSIDNLTDVLNATFGSDRSPEFKKARAVIGKYLDLVDNAAMGSEQDGIAPMRGGNIARHIQQYDLTDYLQHAAAMLDKAVKGSLDEGSYNEDMLSPKQQKIARMAGDPKKIDANDLKALRAGKKKKAEGNAFSGALDAARDAGKSEFEVDGKTYKVQEGWDEMLKAQKERSGPQPSGGSGIKQGKRYGGGAQTDEPETDNETGEIAKKGRGRPKKDKFAK